MRLSAESTAVVLDSTADAPNPRERHPNWRLVPLYVRFGDEALRDHVEISAEEFYRRLATAGEAASTSQPTPGDFAQVFDELSSFERVFCVVVSAKVSGTYESARLAAEETGGRVRVLDSASASAGELILAESIQARLERGTDDDEIDALVDRFRRETGVLFTVDTLEYLVRGGRIGKAAGLAGNLLNVKPILTIQDGEVEPVKRVRGRQKAFAEFEARLVEATDDRPGWHVAVAHADAAADAERVVATVERVRPNASIDVVTTLGPVVGAHAGPGTLGLFWFHDAL